MQLVQCHGCLCCGPVVLLRCAQHTDSCIVWALASCYVKQCCLKASHIGLVCKKQCTHSHTTAACPRYCCRLLCSGVQLLLEASGVLPQLQQAAQEGTPEQRKENYRRLNNLRTLVKLAANSRAYEVSLLMGLEDELGEVHQGGSNDGSSSSSNDGNNSGSGSDHVLVNQYGTEKQGLPLLQQFYDYCGLQVRNLPCELHTYWSFKCSVFCSGLSRWCGALGLAQGMIPHAPFRGCSLCMPARSNLQHLLPVCRATLCNLSCQQSRALEVHGCCEQGPGQPAGLTDVTSPSHHACAVSSRHQLPLVPKLPSQNCKLRHTAVQIGAEES